MRIEGPRFQLRVELHAHKPRVVRPLDNFGQQPVGRHPGKDQPPLLERFDKGAVDLVAVAVAFRDQLGPAIDARGVAIGAELGRIGTQTHGAAQISARLALLDAFLAHPFGDDPHHRRIGLAELGRRGVGKARRARSFDTGHLHAQTNAEERHIAGAREGDRGNLALAATLAESAGHENAMHRLERGDDLRGIIALENLGIDPFDVDLDPVGEAAVDQRLVEALVGIGQADILAHHRDGYFAFGVEIAIGDVEPGRQIGFGSIGDAEAAKHFAVESFLMVLERHRIDRGRIQCRDNRFGPHVAELRDLAAFGIGDRMLGAAQQQIGLDP